MRAWMDSRDEHSAPAYYNLASNAVLRNATARADVRIVTYNYPLNDTFGRKLELYAHSTTDLTVAIFAIIALSFIPASCIVFLIHERMTKTKHLQYASGVSPIMYWVTSFVWDYLTYFFSAILAVIVFVSFGLDTYSGRNLATVSTLTFVYGFAMIPAMYPFCFYFKVPSTGYISLIVANIFVGIVTTLTTFIIELFPNDAQLTHVNSILKWVFLLFPNYCYGKGLLDVAKHEYLSQLNTIEAQLEKKPSPAFGNPLQWDIVGRNVTIMIAEGFLFFALTIFIEYFTARKLWRPKTKQASRSPGDNAIADHYSSIDNTNGGESLQSISMGNMNMGGSSNVCKLNNNNNNNNNSNNNNININSDECLSNSAPFLDNCVFPDGEDEDVVNERERIRIKVESGGTRMSVSSSGRPESSILVQGLNKSYKTLVSKKIAVKDLSFEVHAGECFGLLGVNGAGKTTTFGMLTGDTQADRGEAWIAGFDIQRQRGMLYLRIAVLVYCCTCVFRCCVVALFFGVVWWWCGGGVVV